MANLFRTLIYWPFRFDTGVGGLVLSDQYLQLATKLPSHNVYGLGENLHDSFRHPMETHPRLYPAFARDFPPTVSNSATLQQTYSPSFARDVLPTVSNSAILQQSYSPSFVRDFPPTVSNSVTLQQSYSPSFVRNVHSHS